MLEFKEFWKYGTTRTVSLWEISSLMTVLTFTNLFPPPQKVIVCWRSTFSCSWKHQDFSSIMLLSHVVFAENCIAEKYDSIAKTLRLSTFICHTLTFPRSVKGCELLNKSVLYELDSYSAAEKPLKIRVGSRQPGRYVKSMLQSERYPGLSVSWSKCHRMIWSLSLQDNLSGPIPPDLKSHSVWHKGGQTHYRDHFDPRSHSETCEDTVTYYMKIFLCTKWL